MRVTHRVYVNGLEEFAREAKPGHVFVAHDYFGGEREHVQDYRLPYRDALEAAGYTPVFANEDYRPGQLLSTICRQVVDTQAGIYDMSTYNANVAIELGLALGLNTPLSVLAQSADESLPSFLDELSPLRYSAAEEIASRVVGGLRARLRTNQRINRRFCSACLKDCAARIPNIPVEDKYVLIGVRSDDQAARDLPFHIGRTLDQFNLTELPAHQEGNLAVCSWIARMRRARVALFYLDVPHNSADRLHMFIQLGMAAGLAIPWVMILPDKEDPPSDLRGLTRVPFSHASRLRYDLSAAIRNIIFDPSLSESGIYRAVLPEGEHLGEEDAWLYNPEGSAGEDEIPFTVTLLGTGIEGDRLAGTMAFLRRSGFVVLEGHEVGEKSVDAIVVALTERGISDETYERVVADSLHSGRPLIVLRAAPGATIPPGLRDRPTFDLSIGLRRAYEQLGAALSALREQKNSRSREGDLIDVPELPPAYQVEVGVHQPICAALTDMSSRHTIALYGGGGTMRKNAVAAICREARVRNTFSSGIVWIAGYSYTSADALETQLCGMLSDVLRILPSDEAASGDLARMLTQNSVLVVIEGIDEIPFAARDGIGELLGRMKDHLGPNAGLLVTSEEPGNAFIDVLDAKTFALDSSNAKKRPPSASRTPRPAPKTARDDGRGRVRLNSNQITQALRDAQQAQQDGQLDDAIQICEELLDGGVERADVRYFLGWLYQEADRWDEAAAQFELLLNDPDYSLSCYYALGQCARAQGNLEDATHYFDEAVDRVNLDALSLDESDQLLQLCQEAAEAHREMNDLEGAEVIYKALIGYLRANNWQDQVAEVERLMRETLGADAWRSGRHSQGSRVNQAAAFTPSLGALSRVSGGPRVSMPLRQDRTSDPMVALFVAQPGTPLDQLLYSLRDNMDNAQSAISQLPVPQRSQVAQAVRDIENYVAHGLLTAAIEECLRVMEVAPQYLDVHLMLGEIYVRQGKIEQAIAKYAILIDTYMVNGLLDNAISGYRRILQLEPNNLTYRVKLIELLSRQGRIEEALQERMSAADSYLRLGYADRAIQEYEQTLLASPNNVQVRLSYAIALMKIGRSAQAIGEYQGILQVDPYNILALTHWQIALTATAGQTTSKRVNALAVLRRLARTLKQAESGSYDQVVRLYIQALETNPTNLDLRYALGMIHLTAGRQQEAVTSFQQAAQGQGLDVLARYGAAQAYLTSGDQGNAMNAVRELDAALAVAKQAPPELTVWTARPRMDDEPNRPPVTDIEVLLSRAKQLAYVGRQPTTPPAARAEADSVKRRIATITRETPGSEDKVLKLAELAAYYRSNRDRRSAIIVLRELVRLVPDDTKLRDELVEVYLACAMPDEGAAELRQLADIHMRRGQVKEAALVYQRMAEIDWGMGNRDEALTLLKQAIDYHPDDMGLRQQFVQYCLEVGRKADAAEQQTVLSRYYFASRQTKEAVAALQQLIGMDPRNFEAYDLLGQTYYSVGEYEQAARVYRDLAKVDPTNQMARARLQELQAVRTQMR